MIELSAILPAIIAFAVTAVLGPVIIPILTKLKMGQTERELGVKAHLEKNGTPTMGGLMILAGLTVGAVFFIPSCPQIVPVLFLTLAFGLIGFIDDYLKVVKRDSDGLLAWQKLLLQIVVTAVFCVLLVCVYHVDLTLRVPFTGGYLWDIGILAYPLLFFVVIGTVNGTNFTDGVDGLASSVTTVIAVFFAISSLLISGGVHPIASALAGALMAFLIFNAHPAKVFMGDTGSLALGGFVAGTAYLLHMPIYIVIVGLIYVVEVLSVILQVLYFKKTHGKRLFKMAPIHHHFELSGWSETKVVAVFTVVTALLVLVAFLGL